MAESSIEWTEHTWNPVTGCTKLSPGCKHCYAETMSRRLLAMSARGYENGFKVTLHPERLSQPHGRKKPDRLLRKFDVGSVSRIGAR